MNGLTRRATYTRSSLVADILVKKLEEKILGKQVERDTLQRPVSTSANSFLEACRPMMSDFMGHEDRVLLL
jgi:hypothetical protein